MNKYWRVGSRLLVAPVLLSISLGGCTSAQIAQLSDGLLKGRSSSDAASNGGTKVGTARQTSTAVASADSPLAIDDGPRRFETPVSFAGVPKSADDDLLRIKFLSAEIIPLVVPARGRSYTVPRIVCSYAKAPNEPSSRTVNLWLGSRPDLSQVDAGAVWNYRFQLSGDVAVNRCPSTYGEALQISWGSNAWTELQAHYKAKLEEQAKNAREAASRPQPLPPFKQETVAERKARFVQKIKTNPVPTADDFQDMLITGSMERTDSDALYTKQISPAMYNIISKSSYEKVMVAKISAKDVVCSKQGKLHQCSYSERFNWVSFYYRGDEGVMRPSSESKESGLFEWTERGLVAAKGSKPVKISYLEIVTTTSGGGGQSSGGFGSKDDPLKDYVERDRDNFQNYQDKAQGMGYNGPAYDPMKRY